jgi:hypothetical protein
MIALFFLVAACAQQSPTPDASTEMTDAQSESPAADAQAPEKSVGNSTSRPAALNTSASKPPAEKPVPRFVMVDVPAGTELEVELLDTLSSGMNQVGDPVRARLVGELFADGRRVAPAGAEVLGTVTEVVPLKKFGGQPMITMVFESLATDDGGSVPLMASYIAAGKKQAGRDAAKIGGGAAAGAVIGHQVDDDKGKELGALIGGAIGTAVAAKTGKEIELAAGTTIIVALESDVQVRIGT